MKTLKMKTLRVLVAGAMLGLATGCLVGERYGSSRVVSVTFLPPASRDPANLSYNGAEVLEVLKIVDRVLAEERLTRSEPNPLPPDANGSIAFYSISPRYPISCSVALEKSGLAIRFYERYAPHSSQPVRRLSAELAEELRAHFGSANVRVRIR